MHNNHKDGAIKMCVHYLKNRVLAIKSTLKVEPCFFMTQHKHKSANGIHIKACNNQKADNTQESSAILKCFRIIYQAGQSGAANFTSQTDAFKARYTLNVESRFRQEVWRPETLNRVHRTCGILNPCSTDLMFKEKKEKH